MLAEDHKGYGGSTTIVKLDTKGNQLGTYSINEICPKGALVSLLLTELTRNLSLCITLTRAMLGH